MKFFMNRLKITIFKQLKSLSTFQRNNKRREDHNTSRNTSGNFKVCTPRENELPVFLSKII